MTNTTTISCTLDTTNPEAALGFEAWVDDQKLFDTNHVQARQPVVIEIADDDAEHGEERAEQVPADGAEGDLEDGEHGSGELDGLLFGLEFGEFGRGEGAVGDGFV